MLKIIVIVNLLLIFKTGYSQEQSNFKYQADLTLTGLSKIKTFPDASTSGFGIVYKHDHWALNGQILYTSLIVGFSGDSKGYFNIDMLGGLRRQYNRIELSAFTGIGFIYSRAGESNSLGESQESKSGLGLPIKGKIDYWISKRWAIGLLGYYCVNNINSIYGSSLNVGYRF